MGQRETDLPAVGDDPRIEDGPAEFETEPFFDGPVAVFLGADWLYPWLHPFAPLGLARGLHRAPRLRAARIARSLTVTVLMVVSLAGPIGSREYG